MELHPMLGLRPRIITHPGAPGRTRARPKGMPLEEIPEFQIPPSTSKLLCRPSRLSLRDARRGPCRSSANTSRMARSRKPRWSSGIGASRRRRKVAVAATFFFGVSALFYGLALDTCQGLGDAGIVGRNGASGGAVQVTDGGPAQFERRRVQPAAAFAGEEGGDVGARGGQGGRSRLAHQARSEWPE